MVEVGQEVSDVRVGDRISGEGHVVCGMCRNCAPAARWHPHPLVGVQRDGAFAE